MNLHKSENKMIVFYYDFNNYLVSKIHKIIIMLDRLTINLFNFLKFSFNRHFDLLKD